MTRLHPEDIASLARAIADELRSGAPSAAGIAALDKDIQCDEITNRGYMDHTGTETDGASTSLQAAERLAIRDIEALRRGQKLSNISQPVSRKRKASP